MGLYYFLRLHRAFSITQYEHSWQFIWKCSMINVRKEVHVFLILHGYGRLIYAYI